MIGAEVVLEVLRAKFTTIPEGGVVNDGESETSVDKSDSKSFPEMFCVPLSASDEEATKLDAFCLREKA